MTIAATAPRIAYAGDGVTTVFSVPFTFQDAADLVAVLSTSTTQTTWTAGLDFTVTGGDGATGTITAGSPPAAGTTLQIYRRTALSQTLDLGRNTPFPAESIEAALDRMGRQIQDLQDQVNRTIRFPEGDVNPSGALAAVTNRAEKYLGFNAGGQLDYLTGEEGAGDFIAPPTQKTLAADDRVLVQTAAGAGGTTAFYAPVSELNTADYDVVTYTTNQTLTSGDLSKWVTNAGATANRTFILPQATVGAWLVVQNATDAYTLTIDPDGTDRIGTGAAGEVWTLQTRGVVVLECQYSGRWEVTTESVDRRPSRVVNAEDYGARPGAAGSINRTAIINALAVGDHVILPGPGVYDTTEILTEEENKSLVIMPGATLRHDLGDVQFSSLLRIRNGGWRIGGGGIIDGGIGGTHGSFMVYADGSQRDVRGITIDHVTLQNARRISGDRGDCIYVSRGTQSVYDVYDVSIHDCVIKGFQRNGISFISGENISVYNNTIVGLGVAAIGSNMGIDFEPNFSYQIGGRRFQVFNNRIYDCEYGVDCLSSNGVIANNYISNCTRGVNSDSFADRPFVENLDILHNEMFECGYAVYTGEQSGSGIRVRGNRAIDPQLSPAFWVRSGHSVVEDNFAYWSAMPVGSGTKLITIGATGFSLRSATFEWVASGSGTDTYYLVKAGGGNPYVPRPATLWANGDSATTARTKITFRTAATNPLGTLLANNWGYGDNDSLGFNTVYVRLSDGADPDSKATNFIRMNMGGCVVRNNVGDNQSRVALTDLIQLNSTGGNIVTGNIGRGKVSWTNVVAGPQVTGDANPDIDVTTGNILNDTPVPVTLKGSATYDPPSLADGSTATTTVTVSGAALGDFARASFSLNPQGITITAAVTATNTVTVTLTNHTGGTIDLASGTLRAEVTKP